MSTDYVLLIHGTGAGSPGHDEGDHWWQRNSGFWIDLNSRCQGAAVCLPRGQLFQWSGGNTESERNAGGDELLELMRRFEAEKQGYHIVGHSHGGAVIFAALKRAAQKDIPLSHLRSWTSVGTPFLNLQAVAWSKYNLVSLAVGIACLVLLTVFGQGYLSGFTELIHEGSFSACVLCVVLGFSVLAIEIGIAATWLTTLRWRAQAATEEKIGREALHRFGRQWKGIVSKSDEAFNGLSSTLTLRSRIMWRFAQNRPRTFFALVIEWVGAAPRWFYNQLIAPAVDEFLWSRVQRRMQGLDRSGIKMTGVSHAPLNSVMPAHILSEEIEEEMFQSANAHASETLGGVRHVLGLASESDDSSKALLTGVLKSLSFKELIHTSYFSFPTIREIIASHICNHSTSNQLREDASEEVSSATSQNTAPALMTRKAKSKLALSMNLFIAGLLASLTLLTMTVTRSLVGPYTPDFQLRYILGKVGDPELTNTHGASMGLAALLGAHTLLVGGKEASNIAISVRDINSQGLAIERVAEALALTQRLPEAIKLVGLAPESPHEHALVGMFDQLAEAGMCKDAQQIATETEAAAGQLGSTAEALTGLAYAKCGNQARMRLMFAAARSHISKFGQPDWIELVAASGDAEETRASISVAKGISSESAASEQVQASDVFLTAGDKIHALELANSVSVEELKGESLTKLSQIYARLGLGKKALEVAVSQPLYTCDPVGQLVVLLARENQHMDADNALEYLRSVAKSHPFPAEQASCLLYIAQLHAILPSTGSNVVTFDEVRKAIQTLGYDKRAEARLLTKMIDLMNEAGLKPQSSDFPKALELLTSNKREYLPAVFDDLLELARCEFRVGNKANMIRALQAAELEASKETEYQARSRLYYHIAALYADAGSPFHARVLADRAVPADDRLQAYASIVWHLRKSSARYLDSVLRSSSTYSSRRLVELDGYAENQAQKSDEQKVIILALGGREICSSACRIPKPDSNLH